MRENEYIPLYGEKDGRKVAVTIDRDGKVSDLDIEADSGNEAKKIHLPKPLSEYNTPFKVEIYADYARRENPVEKTGQVNAYKRGEYDGALLDALYPKENLSSKIQRNFFDWAAGTVSAVDDNMSFGLAQDGYQYVTGRRIDNRDSLSFYGGRLTGTVLTFIGAVREITSGAAMSAGGLVLMPETGGTSVVVTTGGLTLTAHGAMTAKNSLENGIDDGRHFIKALEKSGSQGKKFTKKEAVEYLNKDAVDTTKAKSGTKNFDKIGGYAQAEKEFFDLHLDNIREIDTTYGKGWYGELSDGSKVMAHRNSETGGPTLEIHIKKGKIKTYKYRYL